MFEVKGKIVFLDSEVKVSREMINKFKANGIKQIISLTHGIDHIDTLSAKKTGIKIKNTPGINTNSTAEWAIWKLLDCARKGKEFGTELFGKKVLIIGLGQIGQRIYGITCAMGLMVHTFDTKMDWADIGKVKELFGALSFADIIFLCIPYNKKNHHFLDNKKISLLKRGTIIINVGREKLVDDFVLTQYIKYIYDKDHRAWKTKETLQRKKGIIKNARK